jgi:hypothetical protein
VRSRAEVGQPELVLLTASRSWKAFSRSRHFLLLCSSPLREKGRHRKHTQQLMPWTRSEVPGPTRMSTHSKQ